MSNKLRQASVHEPSSKHEEVEEHSVKDVSSMSTDLIEKEHALSSMSDARGLIPTLLDFPGRTLARMRTTPEPVGLPHAPLEEVAELAEQSPWANGYLSVDRELRYFRHNTGGLTFATAGRTAFVVGGPHTRGQTAHVSSLLHAFRSTAREAGYRRILLFPVMEQERQEASAAGFDTVKAGTEAFVQLKDFTLRGKEFADLRQMRNRSRKRYHVEINELDPVNDIGKLSDVYTRWLSERPSHHRMTLVVGKPSFHAPMNRRYIGAFQDGQLLAFVTLVPCFNGMGWGIDTMARPDGTPAGTMDYLISEAALMVREEGSQWFSVGACPMAVGDDVDESEHPWLHRIFRGIYRSSLGNRLFNFRSLHYYKRKFNPQWHPVYFAAWPRVSVAGLYTGCGMWGLFGPPWRTLLGDE